jgi:hypothetical protein
MRSNLKIRNGYVESETLPQHLRNIPKSSFPNISSKLTHVSWIRTQLSSSYSKMRLELAGKRKVLKQKTKVLSVFSDLY